MWLALAVGAVAPTGVTAQGVSAWLDAAASSARPPGGAVGNSILYGLLGGRIRVATSDAGVFDASGRGGRGGGAQPSQWLEGSAGWELARAGRRAAWGLRGEGFGLDYSHPFDYRAAGATIQPRISAAAGRAVLTLRGDARRGTWKVVGDSGSTSGDLALTGGDASVGGLVGPTWVQMDGEAYRGALDGWFTGGTATMWATRGPVGFGVSAGAWSTPRGREGAFSGSVALNAGAVMLRADIGRTPTDPLFGTPASFAASVGASVRLTGRETARRRPPIVELTDAPGAGQHARFRLHRPTAHAVALAGDFTDWRPRPMVRDGDDWSLDLDISPGVHHFAFLVDGRDWVVPAEAPGAAEDEWGRRNATLVIEQ